MKKLLLIGTAVLLMATSASAQVNTSFFGCGNMCFGYSAPRYSASTPLKKPVQKPKIRKASNQQKRL